MKVVPYASEWKEGVIELILPIQQKEFEINISLADQPDLQAIDQFYRKGNGNFWCALDEANHVVGTIALIDIGHRMGVIRKMFVAKDWRGKEKNTASELLTTLEHWATQHNIFSLYLGTIDKFVAAQKFYKRLGFKEITAEELPPAFPKMKVDNMFFKKELITAAP